MSWGDYLEGADYYIDDGPLVCVTHKRFIPCRKDDGTCVLSGDPGDVIMVWEYQGD